MTEEDRVKAALKRQLIALDAIIQQQDQTIAYLTEQLKNKSEKTAMDRLFDLGERFLSGNGGLPPRPSPQQEQSPPSQRTLTQQLETGMMYSDDELIKGLKRVPRGMLQSILDAGYETFRQEVKNNIRNISDESVMRAFELAPKVASR